MYSHSERSYRPSLREQLVPALDWMLVVAVIAVTLSLVNGTGVGDAWLFALVVYAVAMLRVRHLRLTRPAAD